MLHLKKVRPLRNSANGDEVSRSQLSSHKLVTRLSLPAATFSRAAAGQRDKIKIIMQRITHMGVQVWPRDKVGRFSSVRSFFAKLWYYTKLTAVIVAMLTVAAFVGYAYHGNTLNATNQITIAQHTTAPVMERIIKAESGGHQYAANGQVLIHINTNGTVDLGVGQINSVWFSLATKLGYDLTKESDNPAFAEYLYQNYGTDPWYSSKSLWSR
jgi:hypothetical protein